MPRPPAPRVARGLLDLLLRAQALHRQGQLSEAGKLYRQVLDRDSRNFDALHFFGVLEAQRGHSDAALALLGRATAIDPRHAAAQNNLGNALRDARRNDEAMTAYDRALRIRPDYPAALNNRGTVLRALHRPDDALHAFDGALALNPQFPEAMNNRGNALRDLKRYGEALESYDRAIAMRPDYAEAHNNRGTALMDLRRREEILASYERALQLNPRLAGALNNRGNALVALERPGEALANYNAALQLQPDYADAHNNRSVALAAGGESVAVEVLAAIDRALLIDPDFPEAHANRGSVLHAMQRGADAMASYDRALQLKPDYAEAFNNRGATAMSLDRCAEALASYDRALALQPDFADAHWNRALCLLVLGNFEDGWAEYEWRWRLEEAVVYGRKFNEPQWNGSQDLGGKTILLYAEQGFGDTIQFCRYAAMLAERGARVVLEVPQPLQVLLASTPGVAQIVTHSADLPPFDIHCPLLSLPFLFRTRLDSIPSGVPYLHADPDRLRLWDDILGAKTGLRVGLAWSGSAGHKNDRNRSIALGELESLLKEVAASPAAGVQFFSVQKEMRPDDAVLMNRHGIRHYGEQIRDFADTAALMSHMDLVICVDTSVAHLAGAVGAPVWILLPFSPDWRWLLDRPDSPWYPTARLYRQSAIGDWQGVIARIRDDLAGRIHSAAGRMH